MNLRSTVWTALILLASTGAAAADSLTRSTCWTANFSTGSWRKLCFQGGGRVKMSNYNQAGNTDVWTTCNWKGDYLQSGAEVTVSFNPGSGRCSNGAAAPQFSTVCTLTDRSLGCRGSSVVGGKLYEFRGTFE